MAASLRNLFQGFILLAFYQVEVNGQPNSCKVPYEVDTCNYKMRVAHPRDPSKYLECLSGNEYFRSCGPSQVFDSRQQSCVDVTPMSQETDE